MKNQTKVSHTGYWRAMYASDLQRILFLTSMTEEELMDMKLDMGQAWITGQLLDSSFSKQYCERIWKVNRVIRWWLLNWRQYDHWTVLPVLTHVRTYDRLNVYKDMHLNTFSKDHPRNEELKHQLLGVLDLITKDELV